MTLLSSKYFCEQFTWCICIYIALSHFHFWIIEDNFHCIRQDKSVFEKVFLNNIWFQFLCAWFFVGLFHQVGADGKEFKLKDPFADELPVRGFDPGEDTYQVSDSLAFATYTFWLYLLSAVPYNPFFFFWYQDPPLGDNYHYIFLCRLLPVMVHLWQLMSALSLSVCSCSHLLTNGMERTLRTWPSLLR